MFLIASACITRSRLIHIVENGDATIRTRDDVTRLICDSHDATAFAPIAHLTVGEFRDWLLSEQATTERLAALAPGVTPEMAAAVSKIMRLQDLVTVAAKCRVVTRFRSTIGLPGRLATRLLGESLKGLGSDAVVEIFQGRTHGNLIDADLRQRMAKEMAAALRKKN